MAIKMTFTSILGIVIVFVAMVVVMAVVLVMAVVVGLGIHIGKKEKREK